MIKIYTTPACGSCQAAKRYFKEKKIEYVEVDVTHDEESMQKILSEGFMSVPVFEYNNVFLGEFNVDKINKLLNINIDNIKNEK